MTEHLSEREIEIYRSGEGEEAARQGTAAHLAVCDDCVKRVYNAEHSILAVNALKEAFLFSADEDPFHLSQADLKEYVLGHAAQADRIICESHIDICETCREEFRLLSAVHTSARSKAHSSTEPFAWLRSGWLASTPMRVAAAIALIGLLAFGVLLIRRRSSAPALVADTGSQGTPSVSVSVDPSKDGAANETTHSGPAASQPSIVQLKDNGKEIGLDPQNKLTGLDELDQSTQRLVKNALAGEPLARPSVLDELSAPRIKLLGEQSDENAFQLLSPLGKIITETRPTLRWRRLNGATSYVASVFDSKFNLVTRSASLSQPTWTVSAPLLRGQNYVWEVTAVKEGKEVVVPVAPAPRAQFRILDADKLSALQTLKRQKPTSHLALGLTYARLGLLRDAEAEFQYLLKENPDSAVAKKLLRTVQSWR
jgi:anti-sigma factor RsiW